MRVIADVASSPVRGRRSKRADARRSDADRAANIMGGVGNARICVHREMPRGYVARASHSGSCEHDCGDQCSRQKFGLSHFSLQLADPLLGLSDNRTCIRAPVFRNASTYFRMRNHGHAIRLRFFGRITGNDLESHGELTSPFETIARFESEHGPSLRFRRTKHFLSERKLSGSISSLL